MNREDREWVEDMAEKTAQRVVNGLSNDTIQTSERLNKMVFMDNPPNVLVAVRLMVIRAWVKSQQNEIDEKLTESEAKMVDLVRQGMFEVKIQKSCPENESHDVEGF